MEIHATETVWAVFDPDPTSTALDIVCKRTLCDLLCDCVQGGYLAWCRAYNLSIHVGENAKEDALADAIARIDNMKLADKE